MGRSSGPARAAQNPPPIGQTQPAVTPPSAIGVDAFDVLNRVNYSNYAGNISSPFFGRATSAQPPRRLQMSLRARC